MSVVFGRPARPPAPCQSNDRIRLIQMGLDDPCPIPPGATGTVRNCHFFEGKWQVSVRWDTHRSLRLVWPVDQFEIIERPRSNYWSIQVDPSVENLSRILRAY